MIWVRTKTEKDIIVNREISRIEISMTPRRSVEGGA